MKSRSSWEEYVNEGCSGSWCKKDMILEQFNSKEEYRIFAQDALAIMLERKQQEKELKDLLFE